MQGSSANKETNFGNPAGQLQKSVDGDMRQNVVLKRTALVEMKKQLKPFNLIDVTLETIIDLRKSIDSITESFETNKSKMSTFIKDTDGLCDILGDIMIKLNSSQKSLSRSQEGGARELQISEAEERYQQLLKDCRKLIDKALTLFLVE